MEEHLIHIKVLDTATSQSRKQKNKYRRIGKSKKEERNTKEKINTKLTKRKKQKTEICVI